jgi:very-short-patch-repair endonuclease
VEENSWHILEELQRKMVEVARKLRKEATSSEELLWQALRGKKFAGIKFRRQQPIGPFVVDFYAPSQRLAVEVDGLIHQTQVEADRERQALLESLGMRVLRLTAQQVENDLPSAIHIIQSALISPPSPLVGEGGQGDPLLYDRRRPPGRISATRFATRW